jgi:hypothetical protein
MKKMNKSEFENNYATRGGLIVKTDNEVKEWLHDLGLKAKPCDCGDEDCRGWQMIHIKPKDRIASRREIERTR